MSEEYNFGEAAKRTDEQLATELAKLRPLIQDELKKLLPEKIDKERYEKLLGIVNAATNENQKVAVLAANIKELGGVAVRILSLFVKPL